MAKWLSCSDLPKMIRALCIDPELPPNETLDMRWHIAACPSCFAVTELLHEDQFKYCEKLSLLPLALYKTGSLAMPTDPDSRRVVESMSLSEAKKILKHASGRCTMCKLWLPRLKAEKH